MSEQLDQTCDGTGGASLDAELRAAESTIKQGGEPSPHQMDELERLVAAHPERARRLARRLDLVFATTALRSREVPDGVLDGLYDDIRAGASDHRFGRARMSTAFMEAPRSLVAWRRTAVAASVLLAVGGIWLGMREPVAMHSQSSPLRIDEDPRYGLLETLAPASGAPASGAPASGAPTYGSSSPAGFGRAGFSAPAGLSDPALIYMDGQSEWLAEPGIAAPESGRARGARGRDGRGIGGDASRAAGRRREAR